MLNHELLNASELAARWKCSLKKINADRLKGSGCPYVKIGRLVRYRINDILKFEDEHVLHHTSEGSRDA